MFVLEWTGLPGGGGGWSVKRFERSNGLDTGLHKNMHLPSHWILSWWNNKTNKMIVIIAVLIIHPCLACLCFTRLLLFNILNVVEHGYIVFSSNIPKSNISLKKLITIRYGTVSHVSSQSLVNGIIRINYLRFVVILAGWLCIKNTIDRYFLGVVRGGGVWMVFFWGLFVKRLFCVIFLAITSALLLPSRKSWFGLGSYWTIFFRNCYTLLQLSIKLHNVG